MTDHEAREAEQALAALELIVAAVGRGASVGAARSALGLPRILFDSWRARARLDEPPYAHAFSALDDVQQDTRERKLGFVSLLTGKVITEDGERDQDPDDEVIVLNLRSLIGGGRVEED